MGSNDRTHQRKLVIAPYPGGVGGGSNYLSEPVARVSNP